MAASVFFTPVSANVQNVLNSRAAAYSATNRSSDQLNWLLKKTAYAQARAINTKASRSASLLLATKGGLGNGGLYQRSAGPGATSNDVPHYRPDPHLNSVKISSAGDFGSIIKVEVAFTVYSLPQLNQNQAFFDIGADFAVNYGWRHGGPKISGPSGVFTGQIYNFSYTLNDSGGFDCTTFAMGVGINVLGLSSRAATPTGPTAAEVAAAEAAQKARNIIEAEKVRSKLQADGADPAYIINTVYAIQHYRYAAPQGTAVNVGNISGRLQDKVDEAFRGAPGNDGGVAPNGICIMLYDADVIGPDIGVSKLPLLTDGKPDYRARFDNFTEKHMFITLKDLTSIANDIIALSAGGKFNSIVCNENYPSQAGNMPAQVFPPSAGWRTNIAMVSANPGEIVFPGYACYSTEKSSNQDSATFKQFFNLDAWTNGPTGTTIYGGAAPFNYATQFLAGQLAATLINVYFLKRLFDKLGSETTKGQQSADETFSAMFSQIFQSIYKNSGNRFQLSLVSDPKDPKQVLMVDANYVNPVPSVFTLKAVTDGGFCRSISLSSKVPQEMASVAMVAATTTATSINSKAMTAVVGPGGTIPPAAAAAISLDEAIGILCDGEGFSTTNIEGLRSAMQHTKVKSDSKDAIVYPIEFSATMDGVEGFVFGNTVSCNYLPAVMRNAKIVHTILNVNHDISNSDWTTSITTVCRILE